MLWHTFVEPIRVNLSERAGAKGFRIAKEAIGMGNQGAQSHRPKVGSNIAGSPHSTRMSEPGCKPFIAMDDDGGWVTGMTVTSLYRLFFIKGAFKAQHIR